MWFGETSRQSQAEPVKQRQTGISPNYVPEAVRHWVDVSGAISPAIQVNFQTSQVKVSFTYLGEVK